MKRKRQRGEFSSSRERSERLERSFSSYLDHIGERALVILWLTTDVSSKQQR